MFPTKALSKLTHKYPVTRSMHDLVLLDVYMPASHPPKHLNFQHTTEDDEVYFGQTLKSKAEMTLVEYRAGLRRVPDDEIFPRMPPDAHLTVAPSNVNDCSFFLKRTGLHDYDSGEFWHGGPPCHEALMNEVLTMEKLAQHPHPSIVRYHGRRVRRGCITGSYLEQLHQNLHEYAQTHAFAQIDKESFWQDVAPAVEHIHALGLAHNDISSLNIMVRREDASPVLIDFGSCQPLGEKVLSAGSPGWSEGNFSTSDMKHDIYSLGVLKRWLQNPKIDLMTSESERCDA